ncbi:MAG: hypothetical protein QM744_08755 [Mesorhizobium sp.]
MGFELLFREFLVRMKPYRAFELPSPETDRWDRSATPSTTFDDSNSCHRTQIALDFSVTASVTVGYWQYGTPSMKRQSPHNLTKFRNARLRDAVFSMEPEVRLLEGLVATLRVLGEAQDSVESSALACLAHYSSLSVAELDVSLRSALKALQIEGRQIDAQ